MNAKQTAAAFAAAILLAAATLAPAGEASAFSRSSSASGPGGRSATNAATVTRTENGYARSAETTGPGGATASRQTSGSWDAASKTWSKSTAYFGPQGKTGTVERSSSFSK